MLQQNIIVRTGAGVAGVLSSVPLKGHYGLVENGQNLSGQIQDALEVLQQLNPPCCDLVAKYVSSINWVDVYPGSGEQLLTSSSFPATRGEVFISKKATRHIPPDIVLDEGCSYFLAENLYHEALHQELNGLLLDRNYLASSYNAEVAARIDVPWRGQMWQPDRIVHALYVYRHLVPLRQAASSSNLAPMLNLAIERGNMAVQVLSNRLPKCQMVFSLAGEHLYDWLLNQDGLQTAPYRVTL